MIIIVIIIINKMQIGKMTIIMHYFFFHRFTCRVAVLSITAIHLAAIQGHMDIVKMLLGRDFIDINSMNTFGHTVLLLLRIDHNV